MGGTASPWVFLLFFLLICFDAVVFCFCFFLLSKTKIIRFLCFLITADTVWMNGRASLYWNFLLLLSSADVSKLGLMGHYYHKIVLRSLCKILENKLTQLNAYAVCSFVLQHWAHKSRIWPFNGSAFQGATAWTCANNNCTTFLTVFFYC